MDWADADAAGRPYVLYARVDDAKGLLLLRLAGTDPNETGTAGFSISVQLPDPGI